MVIECYLKKPNILLFNNRTIKSKKRKYSKRGQANICFAPSFVTWHLLEKMKEKPNAFSAKQSCFFPSIIQVPEAFLTYSLCSLSVLQAAHLGWTMSCHASCFYLTVTSAARDKSAWKTHFCYDGSDNIGVSQEACFLSLFYPFFPQLRMVTSPLNSPRGARHWMNGEIESWDCQRWLRKKRREALIEFLSQWELNLFFLSQTASTLVVAEARSSGIYSCVASNKVGKAERNVSFIVTGKV